MLSASKTAAPSSGYSIQKSVRLRSSASAYLNRTYTSAATNNNIQTVSIWTKRGTLGSAIVLHMGYSNASNYCYSVFNSDNTFSFNYTSAGTSYILQTSQVFRDPATWYHIVVVFDSTQATAANRVKIYVNGTQVTAFASASYPSQNNNSFFAVIGTTSSIGAYNNSSNYYDGYMAEFNFIDGQALTPTSFGAFNATTGVWQPIKYTGTYGTNGFYLNFSNNASTTTLGYDTSGNGNNWTTNNISLTAGSTYDSMTDVPTLTSATAANYATLNPIFTPTTSSTSNMTLTNGNLSWIGNGSTDACSRSTIGMTSGKFYCEFTITQKNSAIQDGIGIAYTQSDSTRTYGVIYRNDGTQCVNNSVSSYGSSYTTGDVIGVAVDSTNNTVTFYKNNTSQGAISFTPTTAVFFSSYSTNNSSPFAGTVNFGQQPFTYTPPTGFVALNTYNLPTPTIKNGAAYMAATTYTGTGSTLSVLNSNNTTIGTTFTPDLVWIKSRSNALDHKLTDSVRGATKALISDSTAAETTDSGGVTAFNSNGFTVGTTAQYNANSSVTYVGWQWLAGAGSSSSNTNGSITSTVSVNATAGFSVVSYTGNATAGATVGHGLGVAPAMIIVKDRSTATSWAVYHQSVGATGYLLLNGTQATTTSAQEWNNTAPTSSVFTVGNSSSNSNQSGSNIAYCFAPIKGYSAFGSYTGNGSSDGPFVFTNFLPRWVMIKRTDSTSDWYIWDTSRDTYNVESATLLADTSGAETSATSIDGLSNGFKCRSSTVVNASGGTYIFAAFAQNPFNYSLAR